MAWQTVNEVSKRKITSRTKLKAASQEERIHFWKEYFKNLVGNSPKVTDKPITKIINNQLDIKLGQFPQEELDVVLTKIKNRKAAGFDKISPGVWKIKKFNDLLLRYSNVVYNQNTIERWIKSCIHSFSKKGDLGIPKYYRGITRTSIAVKINTALLLQRRV